MPVLWVYPLPRTSRNRNRRAWRNPPNRPAQPAAHPRELTMPDTPPGPASDDTATSLTVLLGEFGGLWQISKTPHGYTAQRRPPPAPPVVLTAKTVAALRQLLQHGYDTGKLAAIMADFGSQWHVERLDRKSVV